MLPAIVIAVVLIAVLSMAGVVIAALVLYVGGSPVPNTLENAAFGIVGSFTTLIGTFIKPVLDGIPRPNSTTEKSSI